MAGNPIVSSRPKEVAVIGGGLGGVLSAILAAEMRDAQGKRRFHVTLYEKEASLFAGASAIAGRLHHGFEYPLDWKTAEDCLVSAIIYKLMLPPRPLKRPDFFTDRDTMRYAVTNATEAAGEFCETMIASGETRRMADGTLLRCRKPALGHTGDGDMIDPAKLLEDLPPVVAATPYHVLERFEDGQWVAVTGKHSWYTDEGYAVRTDHSGTLQYLTRQAYMQHAEHLRQRYAELFDQVRSAKGWSREKAAKELFGLPEAFFRPLAPDTIHALRKDDGSSTGVPCFQTWEPGFNIGHNLAYFKHVLDTLQKKRILRVAPSHEVASITRSDGGFSLAVQDAQNGQEKTARADYVISVAWDGNPALSGLAPDQKVTVFHRSMAILDISALKGLPANRQSVFMFLGGAAKDDITAMFAPLNDNKALLYVVHADAAYKGGEKVLTAGDTKLPAAWQADKGYTPYEKATPDQQQAMDHYLELGRRAFPLLKQATVVNQSTATTLNFQDMLQQREHENSREIAPGHIVVYPTKATHGFTCALEACALLEARERAPEQAGPVHAAEQYAFHSVLAPQNRHAVPDLVVPPRTQRELLQALDIPQEIAHMDYDRGREMQDIISRHLRGRDASPRGR